MSGKSRAWERAFLSLVFHNKAIPSLARGSSPAGYLYVSLHTADPEAGDQSTNEVSYTNYERAAVVRGPSGWNITGNGLDVVSVSPVEDVEFPIGGRGDAPIATFIGIGTETGFLLWSGPLDPPVTCGYGQQPILTKESTITEY